MHDHHKIDPVKWKKAFFQNKRATWIIITLKNDKEFYITNTDQWTEMKEYCEKHNTFVDKLSIQFKSHRERIDIKDVDGLYFAKSIIGILGAESKNTITIGKVKDGKIHKTMWLVPELIIEKEYEDDIENCFQETIIYDKAKENRKEQV